MLDQSLNYIYISKKKSLFCCYCFPLSGRFHPHSFLASYPFFRFSYSPILSARECECDLRTCIHALGFLLLLICVPNGGAQQLKIKRVSKTAGKLSLGFARATICLLVLVLLYSGSWPVAHAWRHCFGAQGLFAFFFAKNVERERVWSTSWCGRMLLAHGCRPLLIKVAVCMDGRTQGLRAS